MTHRIECNYESSLGALRLSKKLVKLQKAQAKLEAARAANAPAGTRYGLEFIVEEATRSYNAVLRINNRPHRAPATNAYTLSPPH